MQALGETIEPVEALRRLGDRAFGGTFLNEPENAPCVVSGRSGRRELESRDSHRYYRNSLGVA